MEHQEGLAVERARKRLGWGRMAVVAGVVAGVPLLAGPAFAASSTGSVSSSSDVAAIAAQVDPAIVDITTTLTNGMAAGTGMVLTSSGEVLTNNHVIAGATDIKAQIDGTGTVYSATVVGYDVSDDVAVLQLKDASGLATVSTTSSSAVSVGEDVVALGNALGKGGTPATASGSVTAVNQTITATDDGGGNPEQLNGLIEVNAPIQPGDSGGPLVNADGKVIGMDSAGSSDGASPTEAATEGYAIPIDHALAIAHQIAAGQGSETVHIGSRAVLGVEVQDSSSASSPFDGGDGSGAFPGFGGFGNSGGSGNSGALGGFGNSGNSGASGDFGGSTDPSGSIGSGSGDLGNLGNLGNLGDLGNLGNLGNLNLGNLGSIGDLIRGIAGLGNGSDSGSAVAPNTPDNGSQQTPATAPSTAPSDADGVTISGVESGGPADKAGLAAGDTITAVNSTAVNSTDDLSSALAQDKPGDTIRVTWVDANGSQQTASVILVAGPPA